MGWTPGHGIGTNSQGISEPVAAPAGQTDRSGLGLRASRKKPRSASKRESLIGVWLPQGIQYGTREGPCLRIHMLDIKGRPVRTNDVILFNEDQVRQVLWWGEGVVGLSESTFPNPKEWQLQDTGVDLDHLSVKILTGALTRLRTKPPTCLTEWPKKFEERIDLRGISLRYSVGIGVPTDFGSHYKVILHRRMLTNPHNPNATTSSCRLCGAARESIAHWGECTVLKPIFVVMRKFDKGERWDMQVLNLLGQYPNLKVVDPGVSLIHFIIWKFIIISLTQMALKNSPFVASTVLELAKRRIKRRIDGARVGLRIIIIRAQAREAEPKYHQYIKWTKGIGEIVDHKIKLHDEVEEWLNG